MTQTFSTNASNDLFIGANGNLSIAVGQDAVEGACSTVSRVSLGEEVLNINNGLPFFQAVFVGVPNIAIFENYLRNALASVSGVISVKSLSTTLTKDQFGRAVLNYRAEIESQYGATFVASEGITAS